MAQQTSSTLSRPRPTKAGETDHPALIALVRMLARQAAAEVLNEQSPTRKMMILVIFISAAILYR